MCETYSSTSLTSDTLLDFTDPLVKRGYVGKFQGDAAALLSAALLSARTDGIDFTIPDSGLESVVNVARLTPAEPASNEGMRLLVIITQDYLTYKVDLPGISREGAAGPADSPSAGGTAVTDASSNPSPSGPDGSIIGDTLAQLGAATAALAHIKVPQSGTGKAARLSRGVTARFVSWICNVVPEVFSDLRDRGLLEVLTDLLLSSQEYERVDVEIAVAGLVIHLDEARIPLRALHAISLLTEKLKVRPGL